uniref:Uncharacterized protein n=1 Tax=Arundo donax TaxID=35708 RepID=A0A0A8ZGP3_ARUDO
MHKNFVFVLSIEKMFIIPTCLCHL